MIQLNAAASEPELYTFVTRSYRMFEQAVYGKAYCQSTFTPDGHSSGAESDKEDTGVDLRLNGASAEVLNTMAACLKNRSCQYERLEEAIDR